jgi:hypothetical protein
MAVMGCHAQAMARVRLPLGRSVPLFREALLKGTLTRLRKNGESMSRHTSLQRMEHSSPECHHRFSSFKSPLRRSRIQRRIHNEKKPLNSGRATPVPKNKLQKNLVTQAGTLTPSPDPFSDPRRSVTPSTPSTDPFYWI